MVFVFLHFWFFPHIVVSQSLLYFVLNTTSHSETRFVIFFLVCLYIAFLVCTVGFLSLLLPLSGRCCSRWLYILNTAVDQVCLVFTALLMAKICQHVYSDICRYPGNFQSLSFLLGNTIYKIYAYKPTRSKHYQVNQVTWKW